MKELVVEIPGLVPHSVSIALKADLTISEDLAKEVNETPAQYGYYAVLAEKAAARFERLKLGFDIWKAEAEERLIEANGKPFKLAKDMERLLKRDPKWKAYRIKLSRFEEEAAILKRVAGAFEIKKDLVQTKNANRRMEHGGRGA